MKLHPLLLGLTLATSLTAALTSGGSRTTIGTYTNTGSLGSPFATGVRTAGALANRTGLIEVLFPRHTLPVSADSDGDGLPDAWETANGFNPNAADPATTDTDHDGLTDGQEYIAGTNPRLATSRFAATSAADPAGLRLSFTTVSGRTYRIESSPNLSTWTTVEDITGDGSPKSVVEPFPSGPEARFFYRIQVLLTLP